LTCDDLEGNHTVCHANCASFRGRHKNLKMTDPNYQSKSQTLFSGGIRFMQMFIVVPWEGGLKWQWIKIITTGWTVLVSR